MRLTRDFDTILDEVLESLDAIDIFVDFIVFLCFTVFAFSWLH